MSLPLLPAKLHPPPLRPDRVRRPRLLAMLDASRHPACRLALVSAPAGYGKTTLVCDWIAAQGESIPTCWLTLDRGDNDLARFVRYLAAALQQVQPGLGAETLAALQVPRPPGTAELGTRLAAELAACQPRLAIVLDDYHLLEAAALHELVGLLVENQPHLLVLLSRADPPLPLARLRARGQLVEIRQADLAFTAEEAAEFFQQRLESAALHELQAEQLAILEQRTEGWAAGLQLAALSLQQAEDRAAFLAGFSGRQQYIADYLVDEVLARQPAQVQDFLLQTSILERLSAGLCAAVTGQQGSGEILQALVRANLFVTPLDQQGEWFRYHGLLADLLRKRLAEKDPTLVPELHRRASAWYREQDLLPPAIEHALSGEAYRAAADMLAQAAGRLLMQGETQSFLGWAERLPQASLAAQPRLAVYYGLGLLMASREVQPALARLERLPPDEQTPELQGGLATLQALEAMISGRAAEAAESAARALERLPVEEVFLRSLAADALGMAQTLLGDTSAAARAFEASAEAATRAGNSALALLALSNQAGLHYLHGQLRAAEAAFQQIIERTGGPASRRSQARAKALLGLGEIAREQGRLEQAGAYLQAAEAALQPIMGFGGPMVALSLARVAWAQGQRGLAYQQLARARQQAQASTTTQLDDRLVDNLAARFWIAEGRLQEAEHWAVSQGLLEESSGKPRPLPTPGAVGQDLLQGNALTLARLLIARGEAESARQLLEQGRTTAAGRGHSRRVIEFTVLQALAWQAQGQEAQALDSLEEALRLAEPEGFRQVFLEEGQEMARLLYRAVEQGRWAEYASQLLAALPVPTTAGQADQAGLIEPLSPRELEVLDLLNQGLTNQQIAERLFISLSTVKGHTSEIYGKLGVENRSQAAARARQLGLLA